MRIELDGSCKSEIQRSSAVVHFLVSLDGVIYGQNPGRVSRT